MRQGIKDLTNLRDQSSGFKRRLVIYILLLYLHLQVIKEKGGSSFEKKTQPPWAVLIFAFINLI